MQGGNQALFVTPMNQDELLSRLLQVVTSQEKRIQYQLEMLAETNQALSFITQQLAHTKFAPQPLPTQARKRELPEEIWYEVFDHLTQLDVLAVCCVCQTWNRIGRTKLQKRIFVDSPESEFKVARAIDCEFYRNYTGVNYDCFMQVAGEEYLDPRYVKEIVFNNPCFSPRFIYKFSEKFPLTDFSIILSLFYKNVVNDKVSVRTLQVECEELNNFTQWAGSIRNINILKETAKTYENLSCFPNLKRLALPDCPTSSYNGPKMSLDLLVMRGEFHPSVLKFVNMSQLRLLHLTFEREMNGKFLKRMHRLTNLSILFDWHDDLVPAFEVFISHLKRNILRFIRFHGVEPFNLADISRVITCQRELLQHLVVAHKFAVEVVFFDITAVIRNLRVDEGYRDDEINEWFKGFKGNQFPNLKYVVVNGKTYLIQRSLGEYLYKKVICDQI